MFENQKKKKKDLVLCLTFVLSSVPSEWYVIAVTSFSFLAVLAFLLIIAVILVCYLRGPEKTPAVLVRTFNQILAGGKKGRTHQDRSGFPHLSSLSAEIAHEQPASAVCRRRDDGGGDRQRLGPVPVQARRQRRLSSHQ